MEASCSSDISFRTTGYFPVEIDHLGEMPNAEQIALIEQCQTLNLADLIESDSDDSFDEEYYSDSDSGSEGDAPQPSSSSSSSSSSTPQLSSLPSQETSSLEVDSAVAAAAQNELRRLALTQSGHPRKRDMLTASQTTRSLIYVGELRTLQAQLERLIQLHADDDPSTIVPWLELHDQIQATLRVCGDANLPPEILSPLNPNHDTESTPSASENNPTPSSSSSSSTSSASPDEHLAVPDDQSNQQQQQRALGRARLTKSFCNPRPFLLNSIFPENIENNNNINDNNNNAAPSVPIAAPPAAEVRARLTQSLQLPARVSVEDFDAAPAAPADAAAVADAGEPPQEHPCIICWSEFPPDQFTMLPCQHPICHYCMPQAVQGALDYGVTLPLRCARCNAPVPEEMLQDRITPQLFGRYQQLLFLMQVRTAPDNYVDCPACGKYTARGAERCRYCDAEICLSCHLAAHPGRTCQEQARATPKSKPSRSMRQRLRNFGSSTWMTLRTKPCPRCKARIHKNGGCKHMSCACGHHFCWNCMGNWQEVGGYGHSCFFRAHGTAGQKTGKILSDLGLVVVGAPIVLAGGAIVIGVCAVGAVIVAPFYLILN